MLHVLRFIAGLLVLAIAQDAAAQTAYPEKPIRIIVGFPPGGPPDVVARLLGQRFAEAWGRQVVVDNITGASGTIAADRVAKALPDGYTLGLLASPELVINPSLHKLAYDPATDFAPVSQVTLAPNMLVVHNALPVRSVQGLIGLARAHPGEVTFATSGSGSVTHMAAELLKSMAHIDIRHIPYKGVPMAIPDLLGGRVTMMFSPISVVLPVVREGKLRALAVTSLKRSSAVPQVPTIAESGYPRFESVAWHGLLAPARTPAAILRRLHLETVKALALPELRTRLADLGVEAIGGSPDELAAVIKAEIPKWAGLISEMAIKAD